MYKITEHWTQQSLHDRQNNQVKSRSQPRMEEKACDGVVRYVVLFVGI